MPSPGAAIQQVPKGSSACCPGLTANPLVGRQDGPSRRHPGHAHICPNIQRIPWNWMERKIIFLLVFSEPQTDLERGLRLCRRQTAFQSLHPWSSRDLRISLCANHKLKVILACLSSCLLLNLLMRRHTGGWVTCFHHLVTAITA